MISGSRKMSQVLGARGGSSVYLALIQAATPSEVHSGFLDFGCYNHRVALGFVEILNV